MANAKRAEAEALDPTRGTGRVEQQLAVMQQMSLTHSGPVPAPWILEGYEKLDQGRAKKLFDLAEVQAHHRMTLENTVIKSDIRRSWAGLACAGIISIAGLSLAGAALWLGNPATAATIVGTVFTADLSAFAVGKWSQSSERQGRAENLGGKKRK